jgi:hypothetical protein
MSQQITFIEFGLRFLLFATESTPIDIILQLIILLTPGVASENYLFFLNVKMNVILLYIATGITKLIIIASIFIFF